MPVTINSDDPPMFGTTLNARVRRSPPTCWASTRPASPTCARSAVRASFAPEDVKTRILGEIDDYAG